ncbi:MAG: (Fe-S)-binding protein [Firmicutes bacterium]|nr:(Fe-S)-binding protein [Bacillota bacterium]
MRVSLFITCLIDAFYPEVGRSAVRILERLGMQVDFPARQTCCGQPAFNSGFREEARIAAVSLLDAFKDSEYVVGPSGSCVSMVRHYLPQLFAGTPREQEAKDLAARTYELCEFLVRVLQVVDVGARMPARVTYHSSCHGARGLGVRDEPLTLLRHVRDLELVDLPYAEDCCGFGGTFAVKFAELSAEMGRAKAKQVAATGAQLLTGIDMSCLMHLGGLLRRQGSPVRVMHVAEILDRGAAGRFTRGRSA